MIKLKVKWHKKYTISDSFGSSALTFLPALDLKTCESSSERKNDQQYERRIKMDDSCNCWFPEELVGLFYLLNAPGI